MQGNGVYQETNLLAGAMSQLRDLLPDTWSTDLSLDRGTPDWGVDGVLTVRTPTGWSVPFLIEAKLAIRGSAKATITQLSTVARGRPAVIITDFANPALRTGCETAGISYLDATGWAYLRDDNTGLFVRSQGALRSPTPTIKRTAMSRLDGPGASSVVRALWDAPLPIGVRDLAERAAVSPGTVAKVLPTLAAYGVVVRGNAGIVVELNRRGLIERWTQDYRIYESNPEVLWRLAPRGPDYAFARLLEPTTPGTQRCALTGYLGALPYLPEKVAPVIPNSLLAVYSDEPARLGDALKLRPATPTTANVVLLRPRDLSLLRLAPVAVPLPQLLADLMTMGGRFDELAEQLFETAVAKIANT